MLNKGDSVKNQFFTREICVCAHLIQTCYAQKTCTEMRIDMTHEEKRIELIKDLLAESPQYRALSIPEDEEEQKRLLR